MAAYNEGAARGEDPLLHKKPEWLKPIGSPVGAIDLRENTGGFTLGGLRTSLDAEVLHVSGEPIPGLFAAGRSTAGLAAWGYASGVSLGDGSFYGRRAGRVGGRLTSANRYKSTLHARRVGGFCVCSAAAIFLIGI